MPETKSRLADDLSRLFNDAAGIAGGVRREVDILIRSQLDRLLSTMDVVTREEFEAVREMASMARAENESLARRLAEHPSVERVRYPGFGGMLSFDVVGGHEAAQRVETGTAAIANATSLGGTTTTLETRTRKRLRGVVLAQSVIDQETEEAPQRGRSPGHRRRRKLGPPLAEGRDLVRRHGAQAAERFRRAFEIVAVGGERMSRRTGFGSHHVEEAVDQGAVVRGHVRDNASAAIMRPVKSWPVRLSAISEW